LARPALRALSTTFSVLACHVYRAHPTLYVRLFACAPHPSPQPPSFLRRVRTLLLLARINRLASDSTSCSRVPQRCGPRQRRRDRHPQVPSFAPVEQPCATHADVSPTRVHLRLLSAPNSVVLPLLSPKISYAHSTVPQSPSNGAVRSCPTTPFVSLNTHLQWLQSSAPNGAVFSRPSTYLRVSISLSTANSTLCSCSMASSSALFAGAQQRHTGTLKSL
jgi:hypothetical protein